MNFEGFYTGLLENLRKDISADCKSNFKKPSKLVQIIEKFYLEVCGYTDGCVKKIELSNDEKKILLNDFEKIANNLNKQKLSNDLYNKINALFECYKVFDFLASTNRDYFWELFRYNQKLLSDVQVELVNYLKEQAQNKSSNSTLVSIEKLIYDYEQNIDAYAISLLLKFLIATDFEANLLENSYQYCLDNNSHILGKDLYKEFLIIAKNNTKIREFNKNEFLKDLSNGYRELILVFKNNLLSFFATNDIRTEEVKNVVNKFYSKKNQVCQDLLNAYKFNFKHSKYRQLIKINDEIFDNLINEFFDKNLFRYFSKVSCIFYKNKLLDIRQNFLERVKIYYYSRLENLKKILEPSFRQRKMSSSLTIKTVKAWDEGFQAFFKHLYEFMQIREYDNDNKLNEAVANLIEEAPKFVLGNDFAGKIKGIQNGSIKKIKYNNKNNFLECFLICYESHLKEYINELQLFYNKNEYSSYEAKELLQKHIDYIPITVDYLIDQFKIDESFYIEAGLDTNVNDLIISLDKKMINSELLAFIAKIEKTETNKEFFTKHQSEFLREMELYSETAMKALVNDIDKYYLDNDANCEAVKQIIKNWEASKTEFFKKTLKKHKFIDNAYTKEFVKKAQFIINMFCEHYLGNDLVNFIKSVNDEIYPV